MPAGFREIGEVGMAREARLLAVCDAYDMTMIGPNCMGVINTHPDIRMDATFAPTPPLPGGISLATQSGALGIAILDHAKTLGIGFAKFCSLGNKAQVSLNDLLRMWHGDPDTKLILAYIENFGNPRNFVRIARETTKDKPVIAVKSGRSEAGSRAAVSHTGSLGGSDLAAEAVFSQTGVLRADSIEELFDLAMAFALPPIPRASRRQRGFRRARDPSRAFVLVPGERGAGPRGDVPICPIPGTRGRRSSNVPRRPRRRRVRLGASEKGETPLVAHRRSEPPPRGVRHSRSKVSVCPVDRRTRESGGGSRLSRRPQSGRPDARSQVRTASGPAGRPGEGGPPGGRVAHRRPAARGRGRPRGILGPRVRDGRNGGDPVHDSGHGLLALSCIRPRWDLRLVPHRCRVRTAPAYRSRRDANDRIDPDLSAPERRPRRAGARRERAARRPLTARPARLRLRPQPGDRHQSADCASRS